MTIAEAIRSVEVQEQDLFALLSEVYGAKYTGMVILHCFEGQPKRAEFPSKQVKLSSALDKRGSKG